MKVSNNLVIFIGPPGAGKGSLSQLCMHKLGWVQLSTGSLCRKHIAEKTEIGIKIDFFIKSGKLIDDKLIVSMVKDRLERYVEDDKDVILDGFPRTIDQAKSLQAMIREFVDRCAMNIVKLSASDDVIIQRLLNRYICENRNCQAVYSVNGSLKPKRVNTCNICLSNLIRRSDDEIGTIRERLRTYYQYEKQLLNFYAHAGFAIDHINVEKPLENVFNDFKQLFVEYI